MKKSNIIIVFLAALTFIGSSCSDFLEQPQDTIVTVDSVFNTPDKAMRVLYEVYATSPVNGFPTGTGNSYMMMCLTDEGNQDNSWSASAPWERGTWGPSDQNEFNYSDHVRGMRNACIFLENVDKVPIGITGTFNWTEELRKQTTAEAKYHLASMHFQAWIRYGGIPIINQVPKITIVNEGGINKAVVVPSATRRSLKSVFEFIVKTCDEAIADLPDSYPASDLGRVTKGAAKALKARAYLFAASPNFNTSTPVVSYGDGRDSLICMGSYDPELWVKAAQASKDVIIWAEANGYELLDNAELGKEESYNFATGQPFDARNREVLLVDHSHGTQAGDAAINSQVNPVYWSWGGQTPSLTVNFIRQILRDKRGEPLELPNEGNFVDFKAFFRNVEPRFHAIAWVPGRGFSKSNNLGIENQDTAKFRYRRLTLVNGLPKPGSAEAGENGHVLSGFGQLYDEARGFFNRKFTNFATANNVSNMYWPIYRLAEFYLSYAEAMNEVNPGNVEILTALNKIRARGGIDLLAPGNPTFNRCFGNQSAMREYIKQERSIELFGEEHRWFDLRRWREIKEKLHGRYYMIIYYENGNQNFDGTYFYKTPRNTWTAEQRRLNDATLSFKVVDYESRVFRDEMYFYPFDKNEVNKGFLIQNPGWN